MKCKPFIFKTTPLAACAVAGLMLAACETGAGKDMKTVMEILLSDEEILNTIVGDDDLTLVGPRACFITAPTKAILRISGAAGEKARITMKCGTRRMGRCTATIPAGGGVARCVVNKIAFGNTRGIFSCSTKVLVGTPTLAGSCVDP